VRARINVLSEMTGMWRLRVRDWKRFNRAHRREVNDKPAPSPNDEYLLYQTLIGAWPLQTLGDPGRDKDQWKSFRERIAAYMLKAIREAKQNTSWINPNTEYESAVSSFVNALLTPGPRNRFLEDFLPFQRRVAQIGLWNSLSQTLLKLTCPGVPDIYQGNELWNFSLVDPDNRRPVDYARRQQLFESIRSWGNAPDALSVRSLVDGPYDGRLKQYLIWKTLCLRQRQPDLFQRGEYLPLAVEGAKAKHVIAFLRKSASESTLVVVPCLVSGLLNEIDYPPIGPQIWGDTRILFPLTEGSIHWRNILTGEALELHQTDHGLFLDVAKALAEFPVSLCSLVT